MGIAEIIEFLEQQGGLLTLQPQPGDGSPEIAWGDTFFYYAPDGVVPRSQPFATIVTKDYPDDRRSRLDRPGAFRLNIFAGSDEFRTRLGHDPKEEPPHAIDPSGTDVLFPHPVYGPLGWMAIVEPGPRTDQLARELLRTAYGLARRRYDRRATSG
ncbi:DUF6194 family protein [Pseudonocardia sp. TRM90224]|uniref:DUF6194 family protein n=1 Tax=Pseudonocardia sp. TRM90224 TaxID=2812678 RepID=UPI001E64DAC3|nr:DUF6194 family protein [Pseudonocardia sp. TRM90224]